LTKHLAAAARESVPIFTIARSIRRAVKISIRSERFVLTHRKMAAPRR
jgi:hypothetical protein